MSLPVPSEMVGAGFLSLIEKNEGGLFVLYGHPAANSLAQKLLLVPLSRNRQVTLLDAGNVFDPYLITRMAQALGREPRELLSKILVSRSFTCHQTHALVRRMASPNNRVSPFVLVLSLLSTFYDDEVALSERRALLKRTITLLKRISKEGGTVLVTSADPPVAIQGGLMSLLIAAGDRVARVGQNPDGSLNVGAAGRVRDMAIPRS